MNVTAHINLAALRHNLAVVRQHAGNAAVLAMIKANAYGHGLVEVATALSTADAFGVARLEEAQVLRAAGIRQPLVVMSGFADKTELQHIAQLELTPVIHTWEQIELLETVTLPQPIAIWVKIDTGMHRLGFTPTATQRVSTRLIHCPNVKKPFGCLSHLARADEIQATSNTQQLALFTALNWSGPQSLANSAPILSWREPHGDWVRPGIMLYGASPFNNTPGSALGLQPVMTLRTRLIATKTVPPGDEVGYGGTWTAQQPTRIGIAAIGYGDGYPRHAKNGTPVLVNNTLCTLAGRISMDLLTIDLSNCPSAQIGDNVTLWGAGLPIETVAHHCDTIAYELLCRVTARVTYVYKDQPC